MSINESLPSTAQFESVQILLGQLCQSFWEAGTVRHLVWFYWEVTDSQSEFVYQTRSRVYPFSQSGEDVYLQPHDIGI